MKKYFSISCLLITLNLTSQNYQEHNFNGNTQLNYQTFQEDLTISAEERPSYTSGYINLLYNYKMLTIGTRVELYNNAIPGLYDYEGYGISNKFVQFQNNLVDITIGNFYEEFGSGLIFRTYSDPNLGIDNSINGLRLKTTSSLDGIHFTALIGKQKSYWEYSESLIRALNININ
jgi:hypothetical protein